MFQAIPVHEDNIFAFKVMGKLTDNDYQQFIPIITQLIKDYGSISLFIELEDFQGWEPKALWDDFELGREYDEHFDRIAIVTEDRSQEWLAKIATVFSKPFFDTQVQTFSRDEFQQAWDWLREEKNGEQEDLSIQSYQSIAVAVDFSEHTEKVINKAVELAQLYNAKLSLIHAIEHYSHLHTEYDFMVSTYEDIEIDQSLFDGATQQLQKIATSLALPNVQQQVIWGSPKSAILSYAVAQSCDLIVTGSHGKRGFARLLGSTAQGIVQNAKCDVLVVKLRE